MTQLEALQKLTALKLHTDTEQAHVDADGVLCEFLRWLGYDEIVDEYHKIDKWYA